MYRVSTRKAANSNPTKPPAVYSKMRPSISRVEQPNLNSLHISLLFSSNSYGVIAQSFAVEPRALAREAQHRIGVATLWVESVRFCDEMTTRLVTTVSQTRRVGSKWCRPTFIFGHVIKRLLSRKLEIVSYPIFNLFCGFEVGFYDLLLS